MTSPRTPPPASPEATARAPAGPGPGAPGPGDLVGQGYRAGDAVPIDDPADPRLEPYARMRERDLVGRAGRFVAEGEVVLRLLLSPRSRHRVESVLLAPERLPGLSDALAAHRAEGPPPPVYVAGRAVMGAVAGFPIHRGVLAIGLARPPEPPAALVPPSPAPALVVGLAGLANHDNVGALFRNAAAFGAHALILDAAACDPLYRKAIRVSAGTALTLPFARLEAGTDWLALADRLALAPFALSPSGRTALADLEPPPRALLLLGTEGPGLPAGLLARTRTIRIPMAPGVDSLNVATAGAIALQLFHARHRTGA